MTSYYCEGNEPSSGWPVGNPGIMGYMDYTGGLPNNRPNIKGNFNTRTWFTAQAYADVYGMTTAAATAYLDAAVARGTVNTGTW